jgi:hypothetical protein
VNGPEGEVAVCLHERPQLAASRDERTVSTVVKQLMTRADDRASSGRQVDECAGIGEGQRKGFSTYRSAPPSSALYAASKCAPGGVAYAHDVGPRVRDEHINRTCTRTAPRPTRPLPREAICLGAAGRPAEVERPEALVTCGSQGFPVAEHAGTGGEVFLQTRGPRTATR